MFHYMNSMLPVRCLNGVGLILSAKPSQFRVGGARSHGEAQQRYLSGMKGQPEMLAHAPLH